MDKKYESLHKQYEMYSEEELRKITVENGYTEIAEQAAKDVLNGDRTAFNEKVRTIEIKEQKIKDKLVAQENDPLYDDIHQIAGDLRFIKNLIVIGLVCGVVLGIISVLGIL